ncbi:methyl-accepting chemotaxis protein, partial [Petrotoga sp. 9PWA.NaAc.5.4]|uniref:HAMP domain-containing protein n=1 Tax=Petrotoga sp. 9PWA.NaAc.5.4 TaxID=1434328 RepID=UPI000CB28ADF
MKNSIKVRIPLIVIIMFILFGLSISFNIVSLFNSNKGLEEYKKMAEDVNYFSQIESDLFQATLALNDYIKAFEKQKEDEFIEYIQKAENILFNLENYNIGKLESAIFEYKTLFNQLISSNQEKISFIENFMEYGPKLEKVVNEFINLTQEKRASSSLTIYSQRILDGKDKIFEASSQYFKTLSEGDKNNINSAFENLELQLSTLEYSIVDDELKTSFLKIKDIFNSFKESFIQIVETIESQEPIIQQMEETKVEILDLLEEQRAELKVQQDTLGPTLIEENNTAIMLTIILTVIAFVVSIIMVIYLIRSITKPLTEFRNKINQFKEGDLTVDFESKSKDEIGQMANALSEMSKELRKSMSSIKGASEKVDNASIKLTKASQESRNNSEE